MKKTFALLSKYFGLGLFLILLVVVIVDFNKLRVVLAQANYLFLLLAFVASLISVSLAAVGFLIAAKIFKISTSFGELFVAGWLGVAMNNLIMSGGAVGYGVRIKLLGSEETRTKQIVSASLFYSYIFQLFLAVVLPVCFFYFSTSQISLTPLVKNLLLSAVALSLLAVIVFSVLFFIASLRRSFLKLLSLIFAKFFKKNWQDHFTEIDELLSSSLSSANLLNIILLFLSVASDWLFCTGALYLAFLALGLQVSVVFLFCAFVISVAIGYISVLPGGLGTQDLSLTGILVLGGYDLQTAILAAVLFRMIYYIIPYGLASLYYSLNNRQKSNSYAS
jgi:uncharacterized protein (TIRG00374 family)